MASTHPQTEGSYEQFSANTSYLLGLMGQVVMQRLRDALAAHDLKPRQFQILILLADRSPIGQRELGEIMDIDHSLLVTMLNPLEDEKLIERRRSGTDRRRHVVTITTAGRQRLTAAAQAERDAEADVLAGLNAEQQTQFNALLRVLRDTNQAEPIADEDC